MDPLSVVSGIAGTVAVGAKVLVALHGFAKGVKSAPEELKLLTRELENLCKIMDNFRKETKGLVVNQDIEDSSGAILDIFIQLDQLITKHTVFEKDGLLKKGWKRVKWHYIEKDIADLRVHLNSNKGNLLVALTLGNELQNGHSNRKLERVQGALEEVIERLQDHDMQTVATCESFTLQRWQEVPSTIAPSSRPTTPNGRISAARSESGILSEAGFSERSIPMSAYQFNDMGNRGKGVLISDGTGTKAYTVKTGTQKKASDSEPPVEGVTRAGPPTSSSKLQTKSTKSTSLAIIPEPEEGDGVLEAKNDNNPKMAAASKTVIKTPSKKGRLKPRGALGRARYRLRNFPGKPRSGVDPGPARGGSGDGARPFVAPGAVDKPQDASAGVITKALPLRAPARAPVTAPESPTLAMERFLQVLNTPPNPISGDPSGGPGNIRKPSGGTYAIWPPYRPHASLAGKVVSDGPIFLEVIDPPALSRDDSFQLQADKRVRLISYTNGEWFYGQVYPEGVVMQFRRGEFRHAPKPRDEEMRMEEERQILALLRPKKSTRIEYLEDGLGIGGNHTQKKTVGHVAISPPPALMEVVSVH
ncbi:hypothetical protein HOY80DRAFT_1018554 [Tuber brumale]|nr:hypothetical protein HOY80DRAFT_1018554 [Tuber brumale]